MKKILSIISIISAIFYLSGCGQSDNTPLKGGEPGRPDTIPALREWNTASGTYAFSLNSVIVLDVTYASQLTNTGQILADDLKAMTGYSIPVVAAPAGNAGDIFISLSSSDTTLGTEGYFISDIGPCSYQCPR